MIAGSVEKIERRLRWGPKAIYAHDVLRSRIMAAAPLRISPDPACELHVMTSEIDHLNLIWTLRSFYHFSGRRYGLCIHSDGTLTPEAGDRLARQFPFARMIDASVAREQVLAWLDGFPRCQTIRALLPISKKEFDFMFYLRAPRMLLLDSDVLFFDTPEALLKRIEDAGWRLNTYNADIATSYSLPAEVLARRSGIEVRERYNSGLALVHRDSVRNDWLEEFLGLRGMLDHSWRFEQTLHGLCSFRFGCEPLPPDYDVYLGPLKESPVVRHYVGEIRSRMYGEGMLRLVRGGFLEKLGRAHEA